MPTVWFDHLAIGAADLAQGSAWTKSALGAAIGPGGAHPLMGTHNMLGRLGAGYLEVIAVDPGAAAPARRRWYNLDDPTQAAALEERPRPVAWVLATDDIDAAAAAADWDVGEILSVTRGDLAWRITVPADGGVPLGVMPTLIEWPKEIGGRAPVDRMAPLGLAIRRLTLRAADPIDVLQRLKSVDAVGALIKDGLELHVEGRQPGDAPLEAMFTATSISFRA